MKSISEDIKQLVMSDVVTSDITYEDDKTINAIMSDIEKRCIEPDTYYKECSKDNQHLYFVSEGFECCDRVIIKSFRSRILSITVKVTVNQENVKLLFDKVYEELNLELTNFEKTLIFNTVKDNIDQLPKAIYDVMRRGYSNITLEEFNILAEKAYKYDELMKESGGFMPR